jgi:hypothetical protein
MQIGPKVLFLDEEISKTIYATYPSKKPQYMKSEDIIQDWFMICAAWKWKGSSKINSVSLIDDMKRYKNNPFDDYHVVKTLHEVISEADVLVGHNMERFDWLKFMERSICHKLEPIDKPKIVDTMKMAQKAGFSYKSLAYVSKRLKTTEKAKHDGNDMWIDIVRGRAEGRIKECVKYCKGDIKPCEDLYDRLSPYMPSQMLPNANLWRGEGIVCCTHCGSTDYVHKGHRYSNISKRKRYRCNECKRFFCDGKSIKRAVMR